MTRVFCDRCKCEVNTRRVWGPTPEGYHDPKGLRDLCRDCETRAHRWWEQFLRGGSL